MRFSSFLIAFALVAGAAPALAQSRPYDAKGLARYDSSYVVCESRYPEMLGHRDEAYLSLWRIKLEPKSATRLTQTRDSAAYKAEQKQLAKTAAKPPAAGASSPLDRQCRGLWGEFQRAPKAKT
jgi:hypothetical protein